MTSGLDGIFRFPRPRQEFIEPIDGKSVDHAMKHVDEIDVWFDVVEFCRFDQRADDRPPFATTVAACEQLIFSSKPDGTDRAFDGIGVEFNTAVMEEARQALPSRKRVANGFSEVLRPDIWESCASSHFRKASITGLEKDRLSA